MVISERYWRHVLRPAVCAMPPTRRDADASTPATDADSVCQLRQPQVKKEQEKQRKKERGQSVGRDHSPPFPLLSIMSPRLSGRPSSLHFTCPTEGDEMGRE